MTRLEWEALVEYTLNIGRQMMECGAEAWRAGEGRALGEGYKKTAPEKEPLWVLVAFVGVTRLELATSRPPDAYSNQLSYTPRIGPSSGAYFSKALQR